MGPLSWKRSCRAIAIGGALLLLGPARPEAKAAPAAAGASALRVIASFEVPAGPSTATDVRWAGDRSVYLARWLDGVAELQLGDGLRRVRQVAPDRATLGGGKYRIFSHLAASGDYLAWAEHTGWLAWRWRAPDRRGRALRRPRVEPARRAARPARRIESAPP